MVTKTIKYGVVAAVISLAVGGLVFGTDVFSYIGSSAKQLRTSAKEAVPMEFELQRARDLLEQIVPEIHANVRLIAEEEVEVENLKKDISQCQVAMGEDEIRIQKLSGMLGASDAVFTINDRQYPREAVKTDLAHRFERHKDARDVLQGKERLLEAREKSLQAAVAMLDKARGQKELLASRIESLEGQYRLVQAAAVGSHVQVDGSKLAQTEKLIGDIKKRLDVAERVLSHEGRFVEPIKIDVVNEKDLLSQVQEYFHGGCKTAAVGVGGTGTAAVAATGTPAGSPAGTTVAEAPTK
jgi:chromosome segregation ATPase